MHSDILRQRAAEELLNRLARQNTFLNFFRKSFAHLNPSTELSVNWAVEYVAEHLEAVKNGEIRKLMINVPPRHSKTQMASIAFPAWMLGHDPTKLFLCASSTQLMAGDNSRACRSVIESEWYRELFPGTILAKDRNTTLNFSTTKFGGRNTASANSSIMGRNADTLIWDDLCDPKQAGDKKLMSSILDWYKVAYLSRLNSSRTGVIVGIQQRLSVDDVAAYELNNAGWTHICIPQIAEERTVITFPLSGKIKIRKEGEIIDPVRNDPIQYIREEKEKLGSYGFSALHQQNPIPKEGGRIKLEWFPRYRELPLKFEEKVLSLDTASKPKEINDPSVCLTFGRVGVKWYLIDMWKKRVIYPVLKAKVASLAAHHKPDAILIEDKSSGTPLLDEFRTGSDLPVVGVIPQTSKENRLDLQTPSMENGIISLPDAQVYEYEWIHQLEERLMAFPDPRSWDELDALSQFIQFVRNRESKYSETVIPFSQTGTSYWRR